MLEHTQHRKEFVNTAIERNFADSAYMTNFYSLTFGNIDDGRKWMLSELELVALVEGGKVFVQATYFLEGDGLVTMLL